MISYEEFRLTAKVDEHNNLVTWQDHGKELSMHVSTSWRTTEQILETAYNVFYVQPAERRKAELEKKQALEQAKGIVRHYYGTEKGIADYSKHDLQMDKFYGEIMRGENG